MSNKIPANALKSGNVTGGGLRLHNSHLRTRRAQAVDALLYGQPLLTGVSGIVAPTANITDVDHMHVAGTYWSYYQTTAQTIHPIVSTLGIEIGGDKVDNETVEYTLGGNYALNRHRFVIGTDDVYFECGFNITDVSGLDQFGILIRKQEAYAVPTSFLTTGDGTYTDFVLFGFAATVANPNPVNISYDLANSGSATVQAANFTWADTVTHRLGIAVVKRKCYFFINGVGLGGRVAYDGDGGAITAQNTVVGPSITLTAAQTFVPGIFLRFATTSPDAVNLRSVKFGTLSDLGMSF